jgi:hypothetical protein
MESTEYLRRLAEQLTADDFVANVQDQPRDQLSVRNPGASELTEIIRCDSDNGGKVCFVWSWGAPIAPITEVRLAAERIAHVLKAVDD